jgi:porin
MRSLAGLICLGALSLGGAASTKPAAAESPDQAGGPPSPFTITAAYTADLLDDVSGGQDPGAGNAGVARVSLAYDGANGGHNWLSGLVGVMYENGSDFTTARVGGSQAVSAGEAQPAAIRLYQIWLQREFLNGKGAVKGGIIDLNATFDVQETAALFLNASHGIGAELGDTGLNGPSDYPTPALGVTGYYYPAYGWTVQLGLFDGVAGDPAQKADFVSIQLGDGALIIAQVEKRFHDAARIEAGVWAYTAAFPSLDRFDAPGAPRQVHGNGGVYGLAEGRLFGRPEGGGSLSAWLRAGLANGEINPIENYLGAGLVYTGLFKGRDNDEAGLAVARAGFGAGARFAGAQQGRRIGEAETDVEASYRLAVRNWLSIQPDIQWVIHPSGDLGIPSALVVGLRLAVTYSN